MYETNRSVVMLIPQEPFWAWLNSLPDTDLDDLSLEDLQDDPNAYLIDACDDIDQAWDEIISRLDELFSAELADWCEDPEHWPDINPEIFTEWFEIRIATVVADLPNKEMQRTPFEPIIINPDA